MNELDEIRFVKMGDKIVILNTLNLQEDYERLITASSANLLPQEKGNIANYKIKTSLLDNTEFTDKGGMVTLTPEGIKYCIEHGIFGYKIPNEKLNNDVDVSKAGRIGHFQFGKLFQKKKDPAVLTSNYFSHSTNIDLQAINDEDITGSRGDIQIIYDREGNVKKVRDTFEYIQSNDLHFK